MLLEPDTDVKNDRELYEAVRRHGKAVVHCYDGLGYTNRETVTFTPAEFEAKWRGD